MSLIPEFVEPQKSSAGKLSLVQYESGQQEGEGRAAKTPKKRYFILKLLFVIIIILLFFIIIIITTKGAVYSGLLQCSKRLRGDQCFTKSWIF